MKRTLGHLTRTLTLTMALLTFGCADADVDITLDGQFVDGECARFFPWQPDIAGFSEYSGQSVMLFTGKRGIPLTENDSFSLVVRDPITPDGSAIPVTPGVEDQPAGPANATLLLRSGCPGTESMLFRGTVSFHQLGTSDGKWIQGELDGEFVDGRDLDEVIIQNVVGTFDFRYRSSEPFQPFPG